MPRFACVQLSLATLGICFGCSGVSDQPELGDVSGKVTLGGEPVVNVSVYFKPDIGRMSIGKTDENGHYIAMYLIDQEGVKVGPNKVWLEYAPDDLGPPIPPKYGSQSELKTEVKPGDNVFDIEMKTSK
ncbi:MAG: hypothetical protein H0T47_20270 [Planctomycetaceae bacterium]|nr:hypothetical protein [Planctomycetaceae bacterium]